MGHTVHTLSVHTNHRLSGNRLHTAVFVIAFNLILFYYSTLTTPVNRFFEIFETFCHGDCIVWKFVVDL